MTKLYVVSHYDKDTDEDNDHRKEIGIYSTEQRAQQVVDQLRYKPGFRDFPDHFWQIGITDVDGPGAWETGFVTVYPGEIYEEDEE